MRPSPCRVWVAGESSASYAVGRCQKLQRIDNERESSAAKLRHARKRGGVGQQFLQAVDHDLALAEYAVDEQTDVVAFVRQHDSRAGRVTCVTAGRSQGLGPT